MLMFRPKVTVVSPFYNEQETIVDFINEICKIFKKLSQNYVFYLTLVDDGSQDKSVEKIQKNNFSIPIGILKLNKNYGHQIALRTGLKSIKDCDYVIVLDSDLQDPPGYIAEILAALESGNQIVLTHRFQRDDQFMKKATAYLYYRILKVFSRDKFILDSGDYWGLSLNALSRLLDYQKSKMIFFRGQIIQLGLKYEIVEIRRNKIYKGKSKYGLKKMLRLALSGLFCTTDYLSKLFIQKMILLYIFNIFVLFILISVINFSTIIPNLFSAIIISTLISLYVYLELRVEFKKQKSEILFEKVESYGGL